MYVGLRVFDELETLSLIIQPDSFSQSSCRLLALGFRIR